MTTLDVRTDSSNKVDEIIFSDKEDKLEGYNIAYKLNPTPRRSNMVELLDAGGDYVLIPFEDIDNLIKALNKARELWKEQ